VSKVITNCLLPAEASLTQLLNHLKTSKQAEVYAGDEEVLLILPEQEIVVRMSLYWEESGAILYNLQEYMQELAKDVEEAANWKEEGEMAKVARILQQIEEKESK